MVRDLLSINLNPERIRQGVTWFAVVCIAWLAAGLLKEALAAILQAPPLPAKGAVSARVEMQNASLPFHGLDNKLVRDDYQVIVERNIFDSENRVAQMLAKDQESATPEDSGPQSNAEPVPSSLPVKLYGTIVSSNPNFSLATISNNSTPNAMAEQYAIGDMVIGQGEVIAIERTRVYLVVKGHREYLQTDDNDQPAPTPRSVSKSTSRTTSGGGIREQAPGKYNIDRQRVEQVMANLSQVMTQARVVPNFENGKTNGWKIFAIKPDSIYSELNIKNGDIIQRINNVEIDSPAKALEMYQQLASESHVTIDLMRSGKKQTLDYDIR